MGNVRFNCGWYLPDPARRVLWLVVVIVAMIVTTGVAGGYGQVVLVALGAALLSAVVTEGVRAALRARPRTV